MKSALLISLLGLACGHSEPFVIADQEIEGPFVVSAPLRLTYAGGFNTDPGISADGLWLTYQYDRGTPDGDRCVAALPASGGQRRFEACGWELTDAARVDGFGSAALRADGLVSFTVHRGLIGNMTSNDAGLYLAPTDSLAGAVRILSLLAQAPGASMSWDDLVDPVWLDDGTMMVLGAHRFLRNVGPRPAYVPRDLDRTPRTDTILLGLEFARINVSGGTASVVPIGPASGAIAWDLDSSTSSIHYIVQRTRSFDEEVYHESVADTLLRMPSNGGTGTPVYGVPVAGSDRLLEQLHGVASGHGRVFISRSWRTPANTPAGPVQPGTPLESDIAEVLEDGSLVVIAPSVSWRWGKIRLSPDGRHLYAEALEHTASNLYRITLP
jgi:hypothetical protein